MDEQGKDAGCEGSCGCGSCRCMKGVMLALVFLVGGIIGYLLGGHHHGMWHKRMMMRGGEPMGQMGGPKAPQAK